MRISPGLVVGQFESRREGAHTGAEASVPGKAYSNAIPVPWCEGLVATVVTERPETVRPSACSRTLKSRKQPPPVGSECSGVV
jgi:hypothetical protein